MPRWLPFFRSHLFRAHCRTSRQLAMRGERSALDLYSDYFWMRRPARATWRWLLVDQPACVPCRPPRARLRLLLWQCWLPLRAPGPAWPPRWLECFLFSQLFLVGARIPVAHLPELAVRQPNVSVFPLL